MLKSWRIKTHLRAGDRWPAKDAHQRGRDWHRHSRSGRYIECRPRRYERDRRRRDDRPYRHRDGCINIGGVLICN
jgi:hypothetical protein